MIPMMNYVFAKNAESPEDTGVNPDGTAKICKVPFTNNRCDSITIEVSGTFTSCEVVFEGKTDLNSDGYTSLWGLTLSSSPVVSAKATGKGIWALDISGIQVFRARVVSVEGGTITVLGRCICSE